MNKFYSQSPLVTKVVSRYLNHMISEGLATYSSKTKDLTIIKTETGYELEIREIFTDSMGIEDYGYSYIPFKIRE